MLQGPLPGPDLFVVKTKGLLNKDGGDTYFLPNPYVTRNVEES